MFKKVLCWVIALSFVVSPLMSTTCYAWASYDGISGAVGASTPLHEDMTQIAYGRLIRDQLPKMLLDSSTMDSLPATLADEDQVQETLPERDLLSQPLDSNPAALAADAPTTKNLLRANTYAEYREKLYFLRLGSYWNDVATDTIAQFLYAYNRAEDVAKYEGVYGNAYNVGRHLKKTVDQGYTSAMVRFSFNERANFLHSMLGKEADGSYMNQKAVEEFQWQWLEVAYKYARDGKNADLSADQKELLSFIDPYNQYTSGSPSANPSSLTPASDTMSEDQLRLRALGSMCHTIEDSFNPAHTIRSYYDGDGSDQFGTILAFGNYVTQGKENHVPWDLPSDADKKLRNTLRDKTSDWDKLRNYQGDFDEQMRTSHTLGLYPAWDSVHQLMVMYDQDATWEEVEAWLKADVLKTNFNDDGSAIIWDAGRRAGNIKGLFDIGRNMSNTLRNEFPKLKEDLRLLAGGFSKLLQYHNNLMNFYHIENAQPVTNPVYHSPYEADGQIASQEILQGMHNILNKISPADKERLFKRVSAATIQQWKTTMQIINGIAQEFSLDLNGQIDTVSQSNTDYIIGELNRVNATEYTGIVAAKDSKAYLLRTTGPEYVDAVTRIQYGAQPSTLEVGQKATISFAVAAPAAAGEPETYYATHIIADNSVYRHTAKGILQSYTDTSMILTSNVGGGDYALALETSGMIPSGLAGQEVIVIYTALPGLPLTALQVYATDAPLTLKTLPEATVTGLYGGQMTVRVGESQDTDESAPSSPMSSYYSVMYGNADLIGTPALGAKVKVSYLDWGDLPTAASIDNLFFASSIVCDDHEHNFRYQANGNHTHQKYCTSLDLSEQEKCTPDVNGLCTQCRSKNLSYIELTRGNQKSEIAWDAAALQSALNTAQSGDVFRFVPLEGVGMMNLEDNSLTIAQNVTIRLAGITLRYTGTGSAITSSAQGLTLENGTVSSNQTALTHANNNAKTLLVGASLYAQKGYTVTGGGVVELNGNMPGRLPTTLSGGGVDQQSAQPVAVKVTGNLPAGNILLALPQTPKTPLAVMTFLTVPPTADDLLKLGYGAKNAYLGDGVFAPVNQEIQLIERITPPDPQKTTINDGNAENASFATGTALEFKAFKYLDFTPLTWSINPSGQFAQVGTSNVYTSGTIDTSSFTPGEHVLTVVHRDQNGNLAAEVYPVTFTKGGGGGGGNGGGGSGGGSSNKPLLPKKEQQSASSAASSKPEPVEEVVSEPAKTPAVQTPQSSSAPDSTASSAPDAEESSSSSEAEKPVSSSETQMPEEPSSGGQPGDIPTDAPQDNDSARQGGFPIVPIAVAAGVVLLGGGIAAIAVSGNGSKLVAMLKKLLHRS